MMASIGLKEAAFITLSKFIGLLPSSRKFLRRLPKIDSTYQTIFQKLTPSQIMQIHCNGSLMYIDPRDAVNVPSLLMEEYEPYETEMIRQSIKSHMTFVDIGANMGYYTLLAARLLDGTGEVIAIEPDPRNFQLLNLSIQVNAYNNVTVVQKAVSNRTSRTRLFFDKKNIGSRSFAEDNVASKAGFVYVDTLTLDSLFRDLGIAKVDVMKIDVEGAEGLVFEGAGKVLHCVNRIFMEFWPQALRNIGTDPRRLIERLSRAGFKISLIDEVKRRCVPIKDHYNSLLSIDPSIHMNLLLEMTRFRTDRAF